jgi:threonine dehydratase
MTAGLRLPSAADVEAARDNIAGIARRTPLWRLDVEDAPAEIYLKLENLQPLGSFKIRAGVNAMKALDPVSLGDGVLGASAGNFGQGLAFAAKAMGVPVTIVAPDGAAETKVAALRTLGATVIRVPFPAWWQTLTTRSFPGVQGVFVHPVAEDAVIAGNATIAAEIVEDLPDLDTVIAPFGGGGLACGIGSVLRRLRPHARMLAVENEGSNPAAAAFAAGGPVAVAHRQSFVDGMGSGTVLPEMWPLVRQVIDGVVSVTLPEIADAIRLLAAKHHVVAEGAGAASVAAALAGRAGGGRIVCIVSGGNIDAAVLAAILGGENPGFRGAA